VINSNLGTISHRFQDTATYSLKLTIEHCGQTAAWLLLTAYIKSLITMAISDGRPTIADPLRFNV